MPPWCHEHQRFYEPVLPKCCDVERYAATYIHPCDAPLFEEVAKTVHEQT